MFANKMNYLLELIVWQNATPSKKGEIARHRAKQPKPFLPEFMKPKKKSEISGDANTMTVDDVKSWLSVPRGV